MLGAELVINSDGEGAVKGTCVMKAQEILTGCTVPQALYLVNVLEFSAETIGGVSKK